MEQIRTKWKNAEKVFGNIDELTTASGVKVKGQYVISESGSVTPSHNPTNGFLRSEGFPMDSNGQTVNDRDYERDKDAQQITFNIAAHYDSRALQTPVIVTDDGIVLSGNGRTMAGIIAARDNTDNEYVSYLLQYHSKYGFSADDITRFQHPRLLFCVQDHFPYNADTFSMFNAQEIKSQSKTEQAVKLGKLVDDETFHRLIRSINTFDTIGDFYNDIRATHDAVAELLTAGVISTMQRPEMFDGETISQQARELLENVLIGKAFSANPDAVRQMTSFKGVRKNIITALSEISSNISLGEYSLEHELIQAVNLCYQARTSGLMRHGDIVSGYARQMNIFGGTIADYHNPTIMMLSDMVNHTQVTRLKKVYAVYNHQARDSASGQTDMFSDGDVKSKDDILKDVLKLMDYGSKKEVDKQLTDAANTRKMDATESQWMEQAEQKDKPYETSVRVDEYADLSLPSGDTIVVKHDVNINGWAGIRLKGFIYSLISPELLSPSKATTTTLPDWFKKGTRLSEGSFIKSICKQGVLLSDGNIYPHVNFLLNYKPI